MVQEVFSSMGTALTQTAHNSQTSKEKGGNCESESNLFFNSFLHPRTLSTCDDSPCCPYDKEMNSKRTRSTGRSKYFSSNDDSLSAMDENNTKRSRSGTTESVREEDQQPSLTSQASDDTLTYSHGASFDNYDKNDFQTSSSSSSDNEERSRPTNSRRTAGVATIDISDNSSDDGGKTKGKPWKQDTDAPNRGKYKMRQTTLDFSSKNRTKKPVESKPANMKVTRSVMKYNDQDTLDYRNGYPNKVDDPNIDLNLKFYNGAIQSRPDGDYITDIHIYWFGDYTRLERHHGYIQWLFPIREHGMNYHAEPLQLHEAKAIQSSNEMRSRVLTSYRLMLDFYGMKLVDDTSGEIQRSGKWEKRFENLKWSSHNYLRITRILKSLGELGYEHLKKPFIEFVLHEALEERTLERLLKSCRDYWIGTIKDDNDRQQLHDRARKY